MSTRVPRAAVSIPEDSCFHTAVHVLGETTQAAPTYKHKFLSEPATVAVSAPFSWKCPASAGCHEKLTLISLSTQIVGCPFSGGQGRAGVDLGPEALVSSGFLIPQLTDLGWKVQFDGNTQFHDIPYNPIPISHPSASSSRKGIEIHEPIPASYGRSGSPSSIRMKQSAGTQKMRQELPDPDIGNMKKPRLVSSVCQRVKETIAEKAKKG